MAKITRFVGLDVHADTISVAVAERDGEVRSLGIIPNRPESVRRLVRKLGDVEGLHACYEAGACGFFIYWQLTELGVRCDVIAPSLIPKKAGERIKTDRRDAEKLARCLRAGDLTPVWVPDPAHEALRDLVRARLCAKLDLHRARQRVGKLLLRNGLRKPEKVTAWSRRYVQWLGTIRFDRAPRHAAFLDYCAEAERQLARVARLEGAIDSAIAEGDPKLKALYDALQALRGVAKVTAATLVTELGDLSRFERPQHLMSYAGVIPSEHSSGGNERRGGITRTGNAHLRRVVVEAAWSYRFQPWLGGTLRRRGAGQTESVQAISWKAQQRLHKRYVTLLARGKPKPKAITAVARELLGFVWAIGRAVNQQLETKVAA